MINAIPFKCLTVCQPWAHLLIYGKKRIENRKWFTSYRGPLLIHAGKSKNWYDADDADDWLQWYGERCPTLEEMSFGAVIGIVDLIDCAPPHKLSETQRSDPYIEGPYCWVTANPRPLSPCPLRGQRGLFDIPGYILCIGSGELRRRS